MRERDGFFFELLGELEGQSHSDHPPERVLRRYLQRRLPDGDPLSEEVERLLAEGKGGRWTLTAVSLHVATCGECAARVAGLRAADVDPMVRPSRRVLGLGQRPRGRNWRRRLAYSIPVASIILGLILLLVFLPHPPPTQNPVFGALAM